MKWFFFGWFCCGFLLFSTFFLSSCMLKGYEKRSSANYEFKPTETSPVTTDQDPTMISYGDLKSYLNNNVSHNNPWAAVVTGAVTVLVLGVVIVKNNYQHQKPQYEEKKQAIVEQVLQERQERDFNV